MANPHLLIDASTPTAYKLLIDTLGHYLEIGDLTTAGAVSIRYALEGPSLQKYVLEGPATQKYTLEGA